MIFVSDDDAYYVNTEKTIIKPILKSCNSSVYVFPELRKLFVVWDHGDPPDNFLICDIDELVATEPVPSFWDMDCVHHCSEWSNNIIVSGNYCYIVCKKYIDIIDIKNNKVHENIYLSPELGLRFDVEIDGDDDAASLRISIRTDRHLN